jgi:prevent-host-death family protein
MLHEMGAFEAKTHFSALLERVEHGEEILITKRGRAVARLLPVEQSEDHQKALLAVEAIRALRKKIKSVSAEEWMEYRKEGRP